MLVREWMTQVPTTVDVADTVGTVRARFARHRVRQFPVMSKRRVVGMVTEGDLRDAPDAATVERFMSHPPLVASGTPVERAAELVRAHRLTALPVVDGDALVGIVSESDLLSALIALCRAVEPTTELEVECDDDPAAERRIEHLLERHGARVRWLAAASTGSGTRRVKLLVRMPSGCPPERVLEDAGVRVCSLVTGRAVEEVT
jgi:acetoin utilization protein AcuB